MKIICVGDIISTGESLSVKSDLYPAHLQRILEKDNYIVEDYRLSAATIMKCTKSYLVYSLMFI